MADTCPDVSGKASDSARRANAPAPTARAGAAYGAAGTARRTERASAARSRTGAAPCGAATARGVRIAVAAGDGGDRARRVERRRRAGIAPDGGPSRERGRSAVNRRPRCVGRRPAARHCRAARGRAAGVRQSLGGRSKRPGAGGRRGGTRRAATEASGARRGRRSGGAGRRPASRSRPGCATGGRRCGGRGPARSAGRHDSVVEVAPGGRRAAGDRLTAAADLAPDPAPGRSRSTRRPDREQQARRAPSSPARSRTRRRCGGRR